MKTKILLLFILIMFCLGTSVFAIDYETFMGYVNQFEIDAQEKNNTRSLYAIQHLKSQNFFAEYLFADVNYSSKIASANTITLYITQDTATSDYSYCTIQMHCYNFGDSCKFYRQGNSLFFSENPQYLQNNYKGYDLSLMYTKKGVAMNIQASNLASNPTNLPFAYNNDSRYVFITETNKKIYASLDSESLVSLWYYCKNYEGIPPEPVPTWTFTKYNNLKLNYSVNEMPLGTFSGDVNPQELNYIWVDYTTQQTIYNSFDYTGMYPSIYNRGMSLFIYNRLLKDHEYDLYIYKENEDTQQFHYTYIFTSGDTGWNGQDTTNNIIDNNNQHQEDNTKQPDFDNYKVSGDNIISSLGVTFSGDPYSNVWFELTQGFSHAFTDTGNRVIELQLPDGQFFEVNINTISSAIPVPIKSILALVVNVFLVAKIIKWIKLSSTMIQSGNIDDLITQNQEEGLTNLF